MQHCVLCNTECWPALGHVRLRTCLLVLLLFSIQSSTERDQHLQLRIHLYRHTCTAMTTLCGRYNYSAFSERKKRVLLDLSPPYTKPKIAYINKGQSTDQVKISRTSLNMSIPIIIDVKWIMFMHHAHEL